MTAINPITPAVLAHLTVLEHLNTVTRATAAEIAAATGKVPSNVKRDLPKLYAEGLVGKHPQLEEERDQPEQWFLTNGGGEALDAMARAANPNAGGGVPFALHSELTNNPAQPRKKFDEEALERLADTIEADGILQPLLVRPPGPDGLRVISAGERRWRAAGIVNARKGDPEAVRLPYIERAATAAELAEEEAYAAYIAVVENGQREPLSTYEEALAYRAMIPARYPSARAAAKETGVDGKTISDRLLALKKLSDQQKVAWRDGNLKWREVRDILRPPAPAEADPNQMDIEEVTGAVEAWKPGEDHDAWVRRTIRAALPKLNPRQLAALVELADACRIRPSGDTGRETEVWPDEKSVLYQLLTPSGLSIGSRGNEPKIARMHPDAWDWLRDNGLLTTEQNQWEVLHRVRTDVSHAAVYRCSETNSYLTPALNPPSEVAAAPILVLGPKPELALLEVTDLSAQDGHTLNRGKAGDGNWGKLSEKPAGGAIATLIDRGLVEITSQAETWYARIAAPSDASAWLKALGYSQLGECAPRARRLYELRSEVIGPHVAQQLAGQRLRYATSCLNTVRAADIQTAQELKAAQRAVTERLAEIDELKARDRLVMVEVTHKLLAEDCPPAIQRQTRVGAYWLDAAVGRLVEAKLVVFTPSQDETGWSIAPGTAAYDWLRFRGYSNERGDVEVTADQLEAARAAAGKAGWEGPGYVTDWLNAGDDAGQVGEPPAPPPAAEVEAQAVQADKDMNDDEDAFDALLTNLREEMGRTHGEAEHWTRTSAPDLAALAFTEILRGDALAAIAALVGLMERTGDTVETARLLHAAGQGDNRPEGKEPEAVLWRAGAGARDFMARQYEALHALPFADMVYRDLSGALNDVTRAKPKTDDVLLVIRKGDVIEKHPGAATHHRLLESQGAIGGRVMFKAQPVRAGKDFGSPGSMPLSDFANFIRGGGR